MTGSSEGTRSVNTGRMLPKTARKTDRKTGRSLPKIGRKVRRISQKITITTVSITITTGMTMMVSSWRVLSFFKCGDNWYTRGYAGIQVTYLSAPPPAGF